MTNAKKFNKSFGMYATELWAMPEEKFLKWLNCEQKQTNADLIRAMTDEELADFINSVEAEAIKRAGRYLTKTEIERGKEQRLDWLREEEEEAECNCKEIFENTADCPCDNCEKMEE